MREGEREGGREGGKEGRRGGACARERARREREEGGHTPSSAGCPTDP